jgi:hypothetical protein
MFSEMKLRMQESHFCEENKVVAVFISYIPVKKRNTCLKSSKVKVKRCKKGKSE